MLDDDRLGQIFDRYRSYVIHQYDLTNHRTTWFVTMNAFLFAAFSLITSAKLNLLSNLMTKDLQICAGGVSTKCNVFVEPDFFLLIVCVIGAFSALIAFLLIESARRPIAVIATKWEQQFGIAGAPSKEAVEKLEGGPWLLLVGGLSRRNALWGRVATPLFPCVVAMAWPLIAIWTHAIHYNGWRGGAILVTLIAPAFLIAVNLLFHIVNYRVFENPDYSLKLTKLRNPRLIALIGVALLSVVAAAFVYYCLNAHLVI
jgi:hypothetical protein